MENTDGLQKFENLLAMTCVLSKEIRDSKGYVKVADSAVNQFEHSFTEEERIEFRDMIEALKFKLAKDEAQKLLTNILDALKSELDELDKKGIEILDERFKKRENLMQLVQSMNNNI